MNSATLLITNICTGALQIIASKQLHNCEINKVISCPQIITIKL